MELHGTEYPSDPAEFPLRWIHSLLEGMSLEMETGNLIALGCVTGRQSINVTLTRLCSGLFHDVSICFLSKA